MPVSVIVLMSSIIVMFIIFGVLIKYKKCYWLISGYNMMSAERKRNVDVAGLSKFMGNLCFAIAGVLLIGTVLNCFGFFIGFAVALGSIFFVAAYMLVKAQKYDNTDMSAGKRELIVMCIVGFIMLIFAISAGSIIYGSRENKVIVDGGGIAIRGSYGTKLDISQISEITLMDSMPEVQGKRNGFDFGNILKGDFKLEKTGTAKLYVNKGTPPYIHIKYGNSTMIINFKDSAKTEKLYNDMKSSFKK